jgi:hypothetical protein
MGKISTRPPSQDSDFLRNELKKLIEEGSGNMVSFDPAATGAFVVDADVPNDKLIECLQVVLAAHRDTLRHSAMQIVTLQHSNAQLNVELKQMDLLLDKLSDVPFDSSLDDATQDLMTHLEATGAAEATVDGELQFDPRVSWGKGDIKPVLREAIISWLDHRLNS